MGPVVSVGWVISIFSYNYTLLNTYPSSLCVTCSYVHISHPLRHINMSISKCYTSPTSCRLINISTCTIKWLNTYLPSNVWTKINLRTLQVSMLLLWIISLMIGKKPQHYIILHVCCFLLMNRFVADQV